jgi:two-component system sensor histidine kinase UhpB
MKLLLSLLARILIVVTACLIGTVGLILYDAHRDIDRATQATAERAVLRLQALYWQQLLWQGGLSRAALLPAPDWRTLDTARVVAPGVCIAFAPAHEAPTGLCSAAEGVYSPAPAWFVTLNDALFGRFHSTTRDLDVRHGGVGKVTAEADPETAMRLAWMHVAPMVGMAGAMALAITLLVALIVARTLMPGRAIIEGLRRLEQGNLSHRIGVGGAFELGGIAVAVDRLAARLSATESARNALTRQIFKVQEDERRALARDLHDEFGQCLAAASACAGSIEIGAGDRLDIAADARAINVAVRRMMTTLKEALVRLRSQDVDDLGLEAALNTLVAGWNGRVGASTLVRLDIGGDLAAVPRLVAVDLFRIAQECLTNAARHGTPTCIRLAVDAGASTVVSLSVEDDGGGDLPSGSGAGYGLLGIRERIAALGGNLSVGRIAGGVRIAATLPFARAVDAPLAAA